MSAAKKRRKTAKRKVSKPCSACGLDRNAVEGEIWRLTKELQIALNHNTALKALAGNDPEDIARMAVALVRARADDAAGGGK